MTTSRTLPADSPRRGFQTPAADPASVRLHLVDGDELLTFDVPGGPPTFQMHGGSTPAKTLPLDWWVGFLDPEQSDHPTTLVQTAVVAREAARNGGSPALTQFGRIVLGLNRSNRWTEALSTALLGDWAAALHDGTGLGVPALGLLRRETRTLHTQLMPLWERRTYGNKRVTLLENPVHNGATLRDLLADRTLPDDPLLDQVPGDHRLAAILERLTPVERAIVLARGHASVATWAQAAEHAGSSQPKADGEKVRRKVSRVCQELGRRDRQRVDGPTGLWTPTARDGGVR